MRNWYQPSKKRLFYFLRMALCCVILIVSLARLISYGWQALQNRSATEALQQAYHAQDTATPPPEVPAETPAPTATPKPTREPSPTDAIRVQATAAPDQLPAVIYPDNPHSITSSAFRDLLKMNRDIAGWLTVADQVDNAVVLGDNTFYLDHGADRKSNVNGALFLDESTVFMDNKRPYTFIIFGHNMKTGAMFGNLKKYHKSDYYYANPFIRFDTLYENGEYVIFSVAEINVIYSQLENYVNVYALNTQSRSARERLIQTLRARSEFYNRVDLNGEDQILLLVTCTGDDNTRLVISARRFRPGETEDGLRKLVP